MPEATNRQLRRRMEYGGAGMPVRDEARLRSSRLLRAQERQEREEEALAAGPATPRATAPTSHVGLDERAHVVVGRAEVDEARPQADPAVDPRRRDPDAPVLLERARRARALWASRSATPAGTWRNGTIESGGWPQSSSSSASPADLGRRAAAPGRGCARSRRGTPAAPWARKASQSFSARNGREYSSVMSTMWCSGRSCGM